MYYKPVKETLLCSSYNSPSSWLMSCKADLMDCKRPITSEVSLAALWFLVRTAFAAAIFMPRTLRRL